MAYWAEHAGGTTRLWRTGEDEQFPAPALVARGFGAFLEHLSSQPEDHPAPQAVTASGVDPEGDRSLGSWLAALPPDSLVVDLRGVPLPVRIPKAVASNDFPVSFGEVVLVETGRAEVRPLPSEVTTLLHNLAAHGSLEKAAVAYRMDPVALYLRLWECRIHPALVDSIGSNNILEAWRGRDHDQRRSLPYPEIPEFIFSGSAFAFASYAARCSL